MVLLLVLFYVYILCIGIKFHNIMVNGGFTGSRTPRQNNHPFPHIRKRGKSFNVQISLFW